MIHNTQATPFLKAPEAYGAVCPKFRRKFRIKDGLRRAVLSITAYGLYEAYLNGERVGDFILAPGWTSYCKRLQVQEYDVTEMLKSTNVLDLYLGRGWACGTVGWQGNHNVYAECPLITASLALTYENGATEYVDADSRWQVTRSKIQMSEIYNGEVFDANVIEEEWEPAEVIRRSGSNLIPQEGEKIAEVDTVKPIALLTTPNGERVIDFGQELTGYVCFRICGEKGAQGVIKHFEVFDKDGNVYTASLRSAQQQITFICDGEEHTYKPHFTFQGFRYIQLVTWPEEIDLDRFTAIVVRSEMRRTGSFECSSPMVNKLYQNVIWGQMGNFLDVPTDCPQRDERLGWTGDAQVFCKTAAYNFDVERFFTKWLKDLAADQYPDGCVPSVIPDIIRDKNGSASAAWADAATVCPWEIYLAYGNREILARQFASMKAWVDYMKGAGETETLRNTDFHYGDWLALDNPPDFQTPATDPHLIATAYFAYSTTLLIKAGEVLGKDMRAYRKLHRGILRSFNETFIRDGEPTTPTQTAYALCIHFDLVKAKKRYGDRLAQMIAENGDRLTTGFVGTAYLMQALTETGHADVAYKLLLQEQFPSWLFSVRMGATTIWEHWDGLREDGSMWNPGMNSFNHYAYGAVASWMYGYMAGIRPMEEAPGYEKFTLAPIPGKGIDYVRATYAARQGIIRSEWYREENGSIRYVFEVPMGTTAVVTLGRETFEVTPGRYEFVR